MGFYGKLNATAGVSEHVVCVCLCVCPRACMFLCETTKQDKTPLSKKNKTLKRNKTKKTKTKQNQKKKKH